MRNRAVPHSGRTKIFASVGPLTVPLDTDRDIVLGEDVASGRWARSCTGELLVPTGQSTDGRVVRARGQVANALAVARGGRSASAERMLREALGVFERRRQYAGAALAAATLSLVLRKRGQVSRANDALYGVARDAGAAGQEQEDYAVAQGLLRPADPITRVLTGHAVANEASIRALAADVCGYSGRVKRSTRPGRAAHLCVAAGTIAGTVRCGLPKWLHTNSAGDSRTGGARRRRGDERDPSSQTTGRSLRRR